MASTGINDAPRRRSASLCLNLIATWLDVNEATLPPPAPGSLAREVELAVQVENAYVGSPCGNLDQIMIWWRPRVEIQSRRWRGGGVCLVPRRWRRLGGATGGGTNSPAFRTLSRARESVGQRGDAINTKKNKE